MESLKFNEIYHSLVGNNQELLVKKYKNALMSAYLMIDHSLDFPQGLKIFKKYGLKVPNFRSDLNNLIVSEANKMNSSNINAFGNGFGEDVDIFNGVPLRKSRSQNHTITIQLDAIIKKSSASEMDKQSKDQKAMLNKAMSGGIIMQGQIEISFDAFLYTVFKTKLENKESKNIVELLEKNGFKTKRYLRDWDKGRTTEKGFLEKYTENLNEKALNGKIRPVIGREQEIDSLITVLMKANKNSPILQGEAGVGKSAIAEGLALKITQGEVPEQLEDATIYSLNMMDLMKGTGMMGAYEEKVSELLESFKEKEENGEFPILFIDEFHTIIGTGSGRESNNLGNYIKPALAKGELRTIGATTTDEWYKFIKKDPALDRRLVSVFVKEPSLEETLEILERSIDYYSIFHGVEFENSTLIKARDLAAEFISDKKFPDKAFDLIDYAGSFVKKTGRKIVKDKDIELALSKHKSIDLDVILERNEVKRQPISSVLKQKVFGQDHVVDFVSPILEKNIAGLSTPNKPIASVLFAGPTGTGKTQLAKDIAKTFGAKFFRLDMTEFSERHTTSRIIGSPDGYIGSDKGGSDIMKHLNEYPRSVVLLDEFEKAHKSVQNLFLQAMDNGQMKSATGKLIDFTNVILIMTSNAGAQKVTARKIGMTDQSEKVDQKLVNKTMLENFAPELLGRLSGQQALYFNHLDFDMMKKVTLKELEIVKANIFKNQNIKLDISDEVISHIAIKGEKMKLGARPVQGFIDTLITTPLSLEVNYGFIKDERMKGFEEITVKVKIEEEKVVLSL